MTQSTNEHTITGESNGGKQKGKWKYIVLIIGVWLLITQTTVAFGFTNAKSYSTPARFAIVASVSLLIVEFTKNLIGQKSSG
jgi:hypothetical protein